MLLPVIYFAKLLSRGAKSGKAIAFLVGFFTWITGVIDAIIKFVIVTTANFIESIELGTFSDLSLTSVEYISYVNAVLPLSEFLVVFGAYLTIILSLITFRWVKSFVPTVAN